jgi:hypothetical protein
MYAECLGVDSVRGVAGPGLLELCGFENRVDGLPPGAFDEAARVYYDDLGL